MSWLEWNREAKKKRLTKTLEETLNLFLKKNSIEQISKIRDMKIESVERQIIDLITMSFIDIQDIVEQQKKEAILEHRDKQLKEINQIVPNTTWFEIKATLASLNAQPEKKG